jgi:hypothetical protein
MASFQVAERMAADSTEVFRIAVSVRKKADKVSEQCAGHRMLDLPHPATPIQERVSARADVLRKLGSLTDAAHSMTEDAAPVSWTFRKRYHILKRVGVRRKEKLMSATVTHILVMTGAIAEADKRVAHQKTRQNMPDMGVLSIPRQTILNALAAVGVRCPMAEQKARKRDRSR